MKDNWELLRIGNEVSILGGFPFSSSKFNDEKLGMPLIRIRDLQKSSQETYFLGTFSKDYLVEQGDVLVGMDGDFNVVKWKASPSLLNQRILKIFKKNRGKIDIEYLYYFLQPFLLEINNKTTATTVKHLSTYDIANSLNLFPPPPTTAKNSKNTKYG